MCPPTSPKSDWVPGHPMLPHMKERETDDEVGIERVSLS